MKKLLIALLSLSFMATAYAQDRGRVSGTIRIGDGTDVVRININNDRNNNTNKRLKRLERAVRQLQNRVYELEDGPTSQESSYNCSVKTCRQSASIHSATVSNCRFFNMFAVEKVRVYAFSGSEAEGMALRKLRSDRDVKIIKEATLSCRENR